MLALELPRELEQRMDVLAQKTGKPLSVLALQAIQEYLEDEEDYAVAIERLNEGGPTVPLEEVARRLGLAD
jgi:RHH-type rel operon transcriptional repressor/antitoxin RelB